MNLDRMTAASADLRYVKRMLSVMANADAADAKDLRSAARRLAACVSNVIDNLNEIDVRNEPRPIDEFVEVRS